MEHTVYITEILQKEVKIKAENQEQAQYIAEQKWRQGEYVLDADDFSEVNFSVNRPELVRKNPKIISDTKERRSELQDKVSIRFAKKQIYGEHNVTVSGQDIAYVNIALPKASKYHGYSLSIKKDSIRDDKYSPKMAFASISDKTYSLSIWDKDTQSSNKIDLSAKEIKKEFDAWKEKKKDVPNR